MPGGFDIILRDVYDEVKNDSFRGNFLAVAGRKESDKTLLSLMAKHFEKGIYILYIKMAELLEIGNIKRTHAIGQIMR